MKEDKTIEVVSSEKMSVPQDLKAYLMKRCKSIQVTNIQKKADSPKFTTV
jgi:hypothetical protein